MKKVLKDISGRKINAWTVIDRAPNQGNLTAWNCVCECGNKSVVTLQNLMKCKSKSCRDCGDRVRGKDRRMPIIEFAFKYFIKYNARHRRQGRGLEVNLDHNSWYELAKNDCYYCGAAPKEYSPYKYKDVSIFVNGLDRIESEKGYSVENCVPCCTTCNVAKNDLSPSEFLGKIKEIYEKHFMKKDCGAENKGTTNLLSKEKKASLKK